MENVIKFKDKKEWDDYLKKNNIKRNKIESGSEGECFNSFRDGYAYKILFDDTPTEGNYDLNTIITTADADIASFLFPSKVFTIDNRIVGYVTKFVEKDLFRPSISSDTEKLKNIDFNKLIKAYYKMKKDVIKLSKQKIKICDLSYNILFDGEKLYGIDTPYYKKCDEDILLSNLTSYDNAIKDVFQMWTDFDEENTPYLDEAASKDIETYLKKIKSIYCSKKRKEKVYTYKK